VSLTSARPLIYLVSDGSITDQNYTAGSARLLEVLRVAVDSRIPLIQLREKQLSAGLLFELAKRIVNLTNGSGTRLLINDRMDVAMAAGADGVHLTSRSMAPAIARGKSRAEFIIGVSTHSIDEVKSAKAAGADFAVYGPVFASDNKGEAVGLDSLRQAVFETEGFPVLGLGGVSDANFHKILETGAAGFAAIRFLNDESNLQMLNAEFDL
jgi:thiamine-phosphate pyrophosphorylase